MDRTLDFDHFNLGRTKASSFNDQLNQSFKTLRKYLSRHSQMLHYFPCAKLSKYKSMPYSEIVVRCQNP